MSDVQLQIRLSQFLEQRGVPSEPVLGAIIAAKSANPTPVFLIVSTRSPRIDLQLRYTNDGLAAVAPGVSAPAVPPRALLRVITEGKRLGAALVIAGTMPARAAAEELMPGVRRWQEILDAMPAGGKLNNRTRYLTERRAAIAIEFDEREAAADAAFVRGIDALAESVGLGKAQRAAFAKLHPMFEGVALSVTTECTPSGPAPCLKILYARSEWDLAIDLAKAIAPSTALRVGSELGKIAGELSIDDLLGIELVFDGGDVPDIVCWMQP